MSSSAIPKPLLRYYGGKWSLSPFIVSCLPPEYPELHYVEPFGGAASVLLRKEPSVLETVNDLDYALVNFFRVLRDRPKELARALELTPYSRAEYESSVELLDSAESEPYQYSIYDYLPEPDRSSESTLGAPIGLSDIDLARAVFIAYCQSVAGTPLRKGWKVSRKIGSRYVIPPSEFGTATANLLGVAERLRGVQIERLDALDLIRKTDSADTVFYVDPPYSPATRAYPKSYRYEYSAEDHRRLAATLRSVSGRVLVSGYDSAEYRELYEGFYSVSKTSRVNGGSYAVETVWANYPLPGSDSAE